MAAPLSRYFDDLPFRTATWFRLTGALPGQTWTGHFRDADGNGVMEFAPAGTPLPRDRWTPELNFLGWQPFGKAPVPDLPDKARFRVSVQWREPHDPSSSATARTCTATHWRSLRLVVLRQRDPEGKLVAADDLEVVAVSQGPALRIDNQPTNATYEQAVEFAADPAGRYAVRVEGRVPAGIRPADQPNLSRHNRTWELHPGCSWTCWTSRPAARAAPSSSISRATPPPPASPATPSGSSPCGRLRARGPVTR